MKQITPLLLLLSCLLTSCMKSIECDNAKSCVINTGNDTVFYSWVCGTLLMSEADTLLPGDSVCQFVGYVYKKGNSQSYKRLCFNNSGSNYTWTVDDCYVEKETN